MRTADTTAIELLKIPSIVLMENAARSASDFIKSKIQQNSSVLVLCGVGNNGGDGLALARHLSDYSDVQVLVLGNSEKMSDETRTNYEILKKMGLPTSIISHEIEMECINFHVDCIIDSLIGVGGSENLRGLIIEILIKANSSNALKFSIDAPTGLNTLNGKTHEHSFRADYTVTMYAIKSGMLLNNGAELCGETVIADLGAPQSIIKDLSKIFAIEKLDIRKIIKPRPRNSSKFDYGKVLIIAGSANYPGAAALAANAAVKSGAGLVYLYTPKIHSSLMPEVIPTFCHSESGVFTENFINSVMIAAQGCDAVAIGPGLGADIRTIEFVKAIFSQLSAHIPLIIDADALRAINENSVLRKNIVLTPHHGEFSRITKLSRQEIEENAMDLTQIWAEKLNCTILLKNVPTIISNGDKTFFNLNGNPGMASGGSGDVLTGIIAGFLAQKMDTINSTALGAFVHAAAADYYKEKYSEMTISATDIIENLKNIL